MAFIRVSLQSMLDHMAWADQRVWRSLTYAGGPVPPQAVRLMAHVVAAERVWLLRLGGDDTSTHPIWPDWELARVEALGGETLAAYHELVRTLTDEDATRVVEYRNSQGVAFQTPVGDILTHVMLHGSYHRGQIALLLRGADLTPVNTDFITFARERG